MTFVRLKPAQRVLRSSITTLQAAAPAIVKPVPWHPHNYQTKAMRFLLEHAAGGLFLDPGLGKTSVVLGAAKVLRKEKLLQRVLVIAPLRVCYRVWPAEQQKWTDFAGLRVVVLHGAHKEEALAQEADFYVINPDGLPWLINSGAMKRLAPDTLVIDEGRRFRRTNTRTFKLLRPLLPKFKRRWLLTGSPNPNGYLDLFGQIYVLDLGNALGQYITHYRLNYFTPTGYGGYTWVLKEESDKAIQERIKPLVLRLDAEDLLKLPRIVPNVVRVDLPDKARKVYDDLEEEMLTVLEGGHTVEAVSAGAASVKCAQVANGGLYYRDEPKRLTLAPERAPRKWVDLHTAKIEAVEEIVDELNGAPVLVAYDFEHDRERLLRAFKSAEVLGGSPKEDERIERAWNAGKIGVLLGQPQSVAHGLNLQESQCQHVICHSLTWDYELYDQFIKRVRRQGNRHAQVFVHHVVARDTVDEAKLTALRRKRRTQAQLLDALRSYLKARHR